MTHSAKEEIFMDWKRKFTSRKFWVAVVEFVTMLLVALGQTDEVATKIAAIIMAGAGVIAYVIGEGLVDAAGAGKDEYTLLGDAEEENTDTEDNVD